MADDDTRMDDQFVRPEDEAENLAPATRVQLSRTAQVDTPDENLWEVIKDCTQYLTYNRYAEWMEVEGLREMSQSIDGYAGLKAATHNFVRQYAVLPLNHKEVIAAEDVVEETPKGAQRKKRAAEIAGQDPTLGDTYDLGRLRDEYAVALSGSDGGYKVLPYHETILRRLADLPYVSVQGELPHALRHVTQPTMVELIWSYWHEEAMLVQTMAAISRRFQNRRAPHEDDPLLRLAIHPLRSVNNLLWGWVQDEQNRLTVQRRAYEYDHHYGISLWGKAVPGMEPADSRSKFLRAFHDLLTAAMSFYEADNDTTVIADAFPLLNSLEDVHVILAEGAHNQFGDLPVMARSEMLMMQYMLARPEMREFLGGRHGVPYREDWMDRVDTMRQLFGWGEASSTHFRDLGVYGERLLLSIRYGDWTATNDQASAANWARYWRPEVQSYVHSYKAVTGVDLTGAPVDAVDTRDAARYLAPSVHLRRQLTQPRRGAGVKASPIGRAPAAASRNGAGR